MSKRQRIAIATSGRFHVLDLARELDALGHEVRFYSFVPNARAAAFGRPSRCHVSLLPLLWPLVGWAYKLPRLAPELRERLMCRALNRAVIARLKPCDVFVGMSGLILESARYARKRFGARVYCERGSRHILSQKDILAGIAGSAVPSDFAVQRELDCYRLADRIVVPSAQVVESFIEQEASLEPKLFVNPYGVDLDQFPERPRQGVAQRNILFVGAWSLRKGADLVVEAVKAIPDVHFVHVGELVDVPFPDHPRFTHHDPVDQRRLSDHYAAADLFILASREEGLALVQAQALASGVPIVCSDRTGGVDLGFTRALAQRIRVVPHDDPDALAEAVRECLNADLRAKGIDEIDRQQLSWRAYGQRYAAQLELSNATGI